MSQMVALDCNQILKLYEEHVVTAPLTLLRNHYEKKFGKELGFNIFFDILLYHYFRDYDVLKKYRTNPLSLR